MRKRNLKYTYVRGRRCEYCDAPIPDHIHDSRKYCIPEVFTDGSTNDCKVKCNNEKAGIKNKENKAIINEWKELLERVKKLVALKGNIVTTEDLNFHEISLFNAIKNEKIRDKVIFLFRGFKIISYHWNEKHIIELI
jgi:hypothetical protein